MMTKRRFFNRQRWHKVLAVLLILSIAVVFKWLWRNEVPLEILIFSGNTMATTYQVKLVKQELDEQQQAEMAKAIQSRLELVNSQMSRYHDGGDIYRLNDAKANVPVTVSPEVMRVLQKAVEISKMTNGAFDITVGPLIRLWGFHDKKPLQSTPAQSDIAAAMAKVGYTHFVLDSRANTVTKKIEGLDIDLSAIAKGRAVDMVAELLDDAGEQHYMIEVGGEIRCKGKNAIGVPWKIGIEKPSGATGQERKVSKVVSLVNSSLATSGDYRSFYFLGDTRVSHTIDPATGNPIGHSLASVSVFAPDCMTADALATAFTVLGVAESMKIADKHRYAAYFIERGQDAFVETASQRFEEIFEAKEE